MLEVFGVTISEGAIADILARAEAPLLAAAAPIAACVRASCSATIWVKAGDNQDECPDRAAGGMIVAADRRGNA
jgi:hypothetical protein